VIAPNSGRPVSPEELATTVSTELAEVKASLIKALPFVDQVKTPLGESMKGLAKLQEQVTVVELAPRPSLEEAKKLGLGINSNLQTAADAVRELQARLGTATTAITKAQKALTELAKLPGHRFAILGKQRLKTLNDQLTRLKAFTEALNGAATVVGGIGRQIEGAQKILEPLLENDSSVGNRADALAVIKRTDADADAALATAGQRLSTVRHDLASPEPHARLATKTIEDLTELVVDAAGSSSQGRPRTVSAARSSTRRGR